MSAKAAHTLAAIFVLLFSTASCAGDPNGSDADALESSPESEGTPMSTRALDTVGPTSDLSSGAHANFDYDAMDQLGRNPLGTFRPPVGFHGTPDPIDGPLEPDPRTPFDTSCYVKVAKIYNPVTSQPIEVLVTVCN